MNVKISQYRKGKTGQFYIQCKGLHSGRPLLFPIPNCFTVETDSPELYQIAYALWVGRYYEPHLKGSVIPYIRLGDAMEVILKGCENFKPSHIKLIDTLNKLDRHTAMMREQEQKSKHIKTALCRLLFS